jgi:hypothetical protein
VARGHKITGNAFKYLLKNHNESLHYKIGAALIPIPDAQFWASEFQRDNPKCPEEIRNGLQKRYNSKFLTQKTNKNKK